MVLRVHQVKKATQVPMENPEMMVTLVNLEVMAHLESATIDQESQLDLANMDHQERQ